MKISNSELKNFYYKSIYIRKVEEFISQEYKKQEIRTPIHLSLGQEVPASAICSLLTKNDFVISHHRSHAHYLGKNGSLKKFFSELYGKSNGCSKGYGGSMHLIDLKKNFLGATAIVSNSLPVGAGFAYSLKQNKQKSRVCIFVGDAGTEEGVFYETINFVALKNLPVIFFCENNKYSVYTHINKRRPQNVRLTNIVNALGVKAFKLNSINPISFYTDLKKIISNHKEKPLFIEVDTYRYCEHTGPNNAGVYDYGSLKDLNFWKENDPLKKLELFLIKKKILKKDFKEKYLKEINYKIKNSINFAKKSKPPSYNKFLKDNNISNK